MPVPKPFSPDRLGTLAALVVCIASLYMLTYSARIESGDTLYLFDAAESLLRFGDLKLDLSARFNPPQQFDPTELYPLQTVDAEPLQILAAMPLLWLANAMPGIGAVHAVWLVNVVVGALSAGLLYQYVLLLGWRPRTALAATFLFAFGTAIWPYSKTFFREPLTLLLILLAAYCIERWRTGQYRSPVLLMLIVVALIAMLLSKGSAVFALPALFVIALPAVLRGVDWPAVFSRVVIVVGVILLVLVALAVVGEVFAPSIANRYNRFDELSLFLRPPPYAPVALHSYLLSAGGSIWGTSPVVLLALPGAWMLLRTGRARYAAVMVLAVLGFAVGYAVLRGDNWFGGLSWPPRFLVPVLPFLMLCALPVIDRVFEPTAPRWLRVLVVMLILFSVWVEFTGVSLWWDDYFDVLPESTGDLKAFNHWDEGLNQLEYFRWVVIPHLWGTSQLDFAWIRANLFAWPVLFTAVAAFALFALWSGRAVLKVLSVGVFMGALLLGLRGLSGDPFYRPAFSEALNAMRGVIEAETHAGDVILLNVDNFPYDQYFMNEGTPGTARIISLPFQPGERTSPDGVPQIVSSNPEVLLANNTAPLIHNLALTRERLWLLIDSGPDISYNVRPVERFMAQRYYPIRVLQTEPHVRLIEYSTVPAPDPTAYRNAEYETDLRYGDHISLTGVDLPRGLNLQPGAVLPISLYWTTDAPLDIPYTVAWFVVNADGVPVAQGADSAPAAGFMPTTLWSTGDVVRDHRALRLPAELPAGTYRVWVLLYTFEDGDIRRLPVRGSRTAEQGTVGVLPMTFEVSAR